MEAPCRRGPGQPVPLVTNQPTPCKLSKRHWAWVCFLVSWVASGRVRGRWQSERKSCPGSGTLGQCSAHWATGTSTADWALNQHLYMYNPQSSSCGFHRLTRCALFVDNSLQWCSIISCFNLCNFHSGVHSGGWWAGGVILDPWTSQL